MRACIEPALRYWAQAYSRRSLPKLESDRRSISAAACSSALSALSSRTDMKSFDWGMCFVCHLEPQSEDDIKGIPLWKSSGKLDKSVEVGGKRNFSGVVPPGLGSLFLGLTPDLHPGLLYAAPFGSAQGRLYGTGVGWCGLLLSSRNIATNLCSCAESTGGASELHRSFVGQRTPSSG
jgi:hypothetical protein